MPISCTEKPGLTGLWLKEPTVRVKLDMTLYMLPSYVKKKKWASGGGSSLPYSHETDTMLPPPKDTLWNLAVSKQRVGRVLITVQGGSVKPDLLLRGGPIFGLGPNSCTFSKEDVKMKTYLEHNPNLPLHWHSAIANVS